MPIQVGDKIFRNIQEQVGKNQADINALKLAQTLGFKNIGTLDEASDIPEGTYNYGEFFFIGTQAPYEVYIYTNHDGTDEFINLGTLAGPQGNIGLPGSTGTVEIVATVTGEPGSDASVVNTGTPGAAKLTFTIPTGAAGPQGPVGSKGERGERGLTGETGSQGIPGDPGQSFMIVGTITSEAQLPNPETTPRNYAYVYNDEDPTTPNRLYYIIGTEGNEEWSYSSFAVAGTTVSVNGSPVYSFNADTITPSVQKVKFEQYVPDELVNGTINAATTFSTPTYYAGDKLYCTVGTAGYVRFYLGLNNSFSNITTITEPTIITASSADESYNQIKFSYSAQTNLVDVNIINITKLFGAGHEPTLAECQALFNAVYIKSNKYMQLISKGSTPLAIVDIPADEVVQSGGGLNLLWSGDLTLSGTGQAIGSITFENGKMYRLVFGSWCIIDFVFRSAFVNNDLAANYIDGSGNVSFAHISVASSNSYISESTKQYIDKSTGAVTTSSSFLHLFAVYEFVS